MFEGGILIEEGDEGNTALRFSELIGNGVQETRPPSTAFDGVWDFRLTERLDTSAGTPLELRQDGATISGCVGRVNLTGTVNGAIARANGRRHAEWAPQLVHLRRRRRRLDPGGLVGERRSVQAVDRRRRPRGDELTVLADTATRDVPVWRNRVRELRQGLCGAASGGRPGVVRHVRRVW